MFKAILFDLDGTLLPMDTGIFMKEYLHEVSRAVSSVVERDRFLTALLASTEAMIKDLNPAATNYQVFWKDFRTRMSDCVEELEPVINEFYQTTFSHLSRVARLSVTARKTVETVLHGGLQIVLATNPVFPLPAIHHRMKWAGIHDLPWNMVTSYEKMHFCKPHVEYYQEIVDKIGLLPEECLMVGNDATEDMAATLAGIKTYLITDHQIGVPEKGLTPDWSGSLENFAHWLNSGFS